ncbi:transmembrane protein 254 [Thalassophryne amazonica]|uniref:transmembrane protein 254 n=1 Tax=Thalassophryne amazonica TaxID=390379 RepID=UPI00147114ED|nr:transmembrane protein 254 [Thalassophryne amazonica]
MAKSDGANYFKRSSLFWIVVVTLSVGYFTCLVFAPEMIPLENLGAFGSFCKHFVDHHAYMMYKGWWAAVAVHVLEACVSLKVCSNKGVTGTGARCLWFIQTLLFGFASLGLLLKYDPKRPKQH